MIYALLCCTLFACCTANVMGEGLRRSLYVKVCTRTHV